MMTCLLCKHESDSAEVVSDSLRDDRSGNVKVIRCPSCGHVQLWPRRSDSEEEDFYNRDLQSQWVFKGTVDLHSLQARWKVDTERRARWIQGLRPRIERVLDVGSGYGFLVDVLSRLGYEATGIDRSRERVRLASKALKGEHVHADLESGPLGENMRNFDAVCAFHVLEHVFEPVRFLRLCRGLVRPGGFVLIEVPNLNDELVSVCEPYREYFWQRAHVSYFDQGHLARCIEEALRVRPQIRSIQRYGLLNLLHWVRHGEPQIEHPDYGVDHPALQRAEELYKQDREMRGTGDTLIAEIRVPE